MNFFLPRTRHPRISVTRLDVTCFQPDAPDTASPRSCILFPALPAPFYWYTDPNVIRFHAAGWTNVNYCWHFRHPRPTYTFTHRIFIDLGIHPKRGIKMDRVPSIDQRKSLVSSIKSSEERNGISPPLPIKINQIFEEEEKGVRNFGAMRRVCRVAGRSASIHSKLSASFLTLSPATLLVRATFSENYALPCPRGLMQHTTHHEAAKRNTKHIFRSATFNGKL